MVENCNAFAIDVSEIVLKFYQVNQVDMLQHGPFEACPWNLKYK
jgi:hypothetical protein